MRTLPTLAALWLALVALPPSPAPAPSAPPHPKLSPPFKKLWTVTTKDQLDNLVVAGGKLYFGTFNSYGAVDLATGRRLWEKRFSDPQFGAEVACDGTTLYTAIGGGRLMACDPRTGTALWSLPRKGYSGPMALTSSTLYCELDDGILVALDPASRKARWRLNLEPKPIPTTNTRDRGLAVEPLFQGGRLFLASFAGEVLSVEPRAGKVLWRTRIAESPDGAWFIGLATDGKRLYYARREGELGALDLATGKKLWSFEAPAAALACAAMANLVLATAEDGRLYALEAAAGSLQWERRLSTSLHATVSPPRVLQGQILVTGESRLLAFDVQGTKLWGWDTEEELFGQTLTPLSNGLLVPDSHGIHRFAQGKSPPLPEAAAERRGLAERLVRRIDKLTPEEQRALRKLGDEAFQAVYPVAKERLLGYLRLARSKNAKEQEQSFEAYSRFEDALRVLAVVMQPRFTRPVLDLVPLTDGGPNDQSARSRLFDVLAGHSIALFEAPEGRAEARLVLPLFLDELRKGEQAGGYRASLHYVSRSSDPQAVAFMMERMRDERADPEIRHLAYVNLARTGGAPGLQAVLAARDVRRTLPALRDFMGLDRLGTAPVPRRERPEDLRSELVGAQKDGAGVLWGWIGSAAVGTHEDRWIARHENGRWSDPLFAWTNPPRRGIDDWLPRFRANAEISRDTDGDGWTDRVESRLGTDPAKRDTDEDGLEDSQDRNPLAPAREITEEEKVLAAAFEGRFRYAEGGYSPALVALPQGVKPLELAGWEWLILTSAHPERSPLRKVFPGGVGLVAFRLPQLDFEGAAVHSKESKRFILWNRDRTEARLHLSTTFAGLNGTGYDLQLKKFGSDWIVVQEQMIWIS